MKAQEVGSASQQASLRRRYLGKLHRARWFVILGFLGLVGGLGEEQAICTHVIL